MSDELQVSRSASGIVSIIMNRHCFWMVSTCIATTGPPVSAGQGAE